MKSFPHIFLTGHPSVGKTTIIKGVQSSIQQKCGSNVITSGFYTEECRGKDGNRIGFDIVYWPTTAAAAAAAPTTTTTQQEPQRVALSRMMDRVQKGKPFVGKYLVDIDNVAKYAIGSISTGGETTSNKKSHELVVLDEIGKMEMLCPQFIPAVTKLLSSTNSSSSNHRIVFGTLPTPRYGRVIADVETVRARDDVLVLHVTKDNRDELRELLSGILQKALLETKDENSDMIESLEPYRYTRPIGASSLNGDRTSSKKKGNRQTTKNNQVADKRETDVSTGDSTSISVKPCGPLISPSIPPKALIVGETASPLPENPEHAYCERSMWIVLSKMFGLPYKPILDPSLASETALASYKVVKNMALAKGICIWDVLANVHQKSKGRKKQKPVDQPNNIEGLLKKNPSIKVIGFIGQKAHAKYKSLQQDTTINGRKVELVTLPSSSPSNTRLCTAEKADTWKSAFEIV